jgi:transcriptional regulator GlxA family with amidase domain
LAADDPLVAKALRFISENGHERILVDDVVFSSSTNRRTLERKFRASMGCSIAEEISRLRIERSKRIMLETDASFKSIAVDLGFRNADHFCKVFSRFENITPSIYRRQEKRKG